MMKLCSRLQVMIGTSAEAASVALDPTTGGVRALVGA